MCNLHSIHAGLWAVLLLSAAAGASQVQFDIVPLVNNQPVTTPNPEVTVAPGAQVDYEVTALVTSVSPTTAPDGTTTPDNNGLGYFRFDILTDLGAPQVSATGIETSINNTFSFLRDLGTPTNDDIIRVRAAQDTLTGSTPLVAGIAQTQAQVIVGGVLTTPTVEGTYHVSVGGTLEASVFAAGGTSTLDPATVTAGPGFTIQVAAATSGTGTTTNPADSGTTTDQSGSTTTTTGTQTTDQTTTQTPTTAPATPSAQKITLGALTIGLGVFALWAILNLGAFAGTIAFVVALGTALAWALTSP